VSEQSVPLTPARRPGLPAWLRSLVLLVIFTQASALLMNQPAAYWLDPRYAAADLPFSFLLRGGPWLYLAAAGLYLAGCAWLLKKLDTLPGLALAAALLLLHALALYRSTLCGFYPIYVAQGKAGCLAWKDTPSIVIFAILILGLLLGSLPERVTRYARHLQRAALALAATWVLLLGYGLLRAAFPPASPWRPLAPAHSPGVRENAAVAYDSQRQVLVLFGGVTDKNSKGWVYDNSTWEWDGQDWHQIESAVAPTGRIFHAMAYDKVRQKVILYGGQNSSGNLSDLWEWDGVNWRRLCPVCNPAQRFEHKMIFDDRLEQVVLYGGQNNQKGFAEAWTWDGAAWSYFSFETSVPAVYDAPLVYETGRQRAVSFMGGRWGGTWVWQANAWKKLDPALQPPLRDHAVMVYDPLSGQSILFGGSTQAGTKFNDTWLLDGETWTRLETPSAPPQRDGAVAFFDPLRRSVILYGGAGGGRFLGDMWELVLPGGNQE
jgi:hypothetical protein